MKKILTFIFLITLSLSLVGCNKAPAEKEEPEQTVQEEQEETEEDSSKEAEAREPEEEEYLRDSFYYSQLTNKEKSIYREIEKAVLDKKVWFEFSEPVATDTFNRVRAAIIGDCPEYFFLKDAAAYYHNYSNADKVHVLGEMEIYYPDNLEEETAKIKEISGRILSEIPDDASGYDKYKMIFDWVMKNASYNNGERDQDYRSVFLDGETVCTGYATAIQYLCQEEGIPCAVVAGDTAEDAHAWNLVEIDGKTYWSDVTATDTLYGDVDENYEGPIDYSTLLMTDQEVEGYDKFKSFIYITNNSFVYPECNDDSLNYYKLNGMYFDSCGEELRNYIGEKLAADDRIVLMQFSNKEAFEECQEYLAGDEIFDLIWEELPDASEANLEYYINDYTRQLRVDFDIYY